jgi:autotransporter-associated beta strand protein
MVFPDWSAWVSPRATVPAKRRRRFSSGLLLEPLEERLALSLHTWTGAVSNLWSDNGNWNEGSPAGDSAADLLFPASGVTRLTSTDNLPGQAPINSIQFAGIGFALDASAGSSIALATGISTTNTTGTNVISLPISLPPGFQSVSVAGSGSLVISGPLSGSGALATFGAGELVLSGNNGQFSGGVRMVSGTLTVGSNNAVGTALLILNSGLLRSNGPLALGNDYQVGSGTQPGVVTIGGSSNLTLTGQGNLLFDDLTVNSTATISLLGNISGSGGLFMLGTGTLILGGTNTFSGNTTISAGTVLVNGTNSASQAVLSAGILGGTGFVNGITATGGTIRPGSATTVGTLSTAGAQLNASTFLAIKFSSTPTGNVSDQLQVRGAGNLGGSTLQLIPLTGFQSPVGEVFNLVTNGGTGMITGTFANASPLTIPGNGRFQLAYSSTVVTLTHIDTPPTLSAVSVTSPVFETRPTTLSGTITDPDPLDTFTLQITWGDGSPVQPVNLPAGSTSFSVQQTYGREGTYTINLTLSDGHPGGTATASTTITVLDRLQSPMALAVAAVEGQPFSGTVATFQDAVDGAATDFSATIHWGDGSPNAAGQIVKTGAGRFQISGTHTYAEEGSYSITVTIQDADGTVVSPTSAATVADAPLFVTGTTFSAVEGASFNQAVASFTDAGGPEPVGNYTATIDWGDGTPTTSGIITLAGTVFSVTGSHAYREEGSYRVTVSVHDDGGFMATVASTATVADAPLIFVPPPGSSGSFFHVSGAEGLPLNANFRTFVVDSGGLEQAADYSATIDWGDGTPASAGTFNPPLIEFVAGNHTYTSEGTYSVTITISHDTARPISVTITATVGGFITSLYKDVLGRLPDPAGLNFWVQRHHSGMPREQIALSFWVSAEHRGIEVDQFYATFLHRAADPAGRTGWVNALLNGASEAALVAAFVTSPEYTALHPDNASFVNGLYNDVLRRAGDAGGAGFWQDQLQVGARSRADVALAFLSSTEAYTQAINQYYETFLGRSADAGGLRAFLAAIQSGTATPASIAAIFLGSDEYFARAIALASS